VGTVVQIQISVQGSQPSGSIAIQGPVGNLKPKKATHGILESSKIPGVHGINCEMI
jgi:hypothetical protein